MAGPQMEDSALDMVTCEDDGEDEEGIQNGAEEDEECQEIIEPAEVKAEPAEQSDRLTPQEEEMEEEAEACAVESDEFAQKEHHGMKNLQEDEKQGRTYHEFNEEAYCDRFTRDIFPSKDVVQDEFDERVVCLDKFTCDLQFKMDTDRFGGRPLLNYTFPSLWSGSRATQGVTNGKAYFEIKRTVNLPLKDGFSEFPLLRVGWSVGQSGPQLGEDDLSFAYDSRGFKATNSHFEIYGKTFREYDVIGCYADLEGAEIKLSFSKNGVDLGQAFVLEKSSLGDKALIPHVICKGCEFQVNFGQKLQPWHQPRSGFKYLQDMTSQELRRTSPVPKSIEECELLMMVGLPGAGKTTWVQKHMQENPDKNYIHLCIDRLIPQLKTAGPEPFEENSKTRDRLIKVATQCLNRLIAIAGHRRGNYILDQCTVYEGAQKRKLKWFPHFIRKAILVVPKEEEWKRRLALRKEEGEIYPEPILLDMRAHFSIPKKKILHVSMVIHSELSHGESATVIWNLKKEAYEKLGPIQKDTTRNTFKEISKPHPYRRPSQIQQRPRTKGVLKSFRGPHRPQQNRFTAPQNYNLQYSEVQNWQDFSGRPPYWNYNGWY
ncbi:heterogeneous nuclear ribonucleo U 2 isoform X2 [Pelobates cultripes]|uniref:Heterogeneous nuclear ribonucleo U 2 isoform X2 n=1 Tax=Pelobates cultripes TaxID=61616 RepID=A0AAD1TK25_PELCU|nr:heterogeneous nuclear ribonucleo U 2 isoform X2 [Pelobates cultripes]